MIDFKNIKKKTSWNILDTYILKKFIFSFFFALSLLMVIIVVFDLSENIQRFLDNKIPASRIIFGYYANFIPYFANLFIPLFTFISVIWFTSQLSQRNEIVSILSNGINFYRMAVPYVVGAFMIAIFSFAMSNFIIPSTNKKLENFKNEYFRKYTSSSSNLHLRNSYNTYIYIEHWNVDENSGFNFTYEVLGSTTTIYKLAAQNIRYDKETKKWVLEHYTKRRIYADHESFESGERMDTVFNTTPLNLTKDEGVISTMNYNQMQKYIKQEKANGSALVKYYVVEQNKRMANPLGTIIMSLLGLAVASRKSNRGVGVHLFIGMGMAFSFIFLQQVSDVFSVSGTLPPAFGAWVPDLVFLLICAVMLRFSQK
ncbi:MAG: LptF/LptG family permease [Bacteroidales bacterium]|jgi:lipopolysaccharide export system permease protein|nr:LptF/LptG family permease [Bacteroidales bacterium]